MKFRPLLFTVLFLSIISTAKGQESPQQKFRQLDWLVGEWIRTNAKQGQSGYEVWTKASDTKLIGKGVTLKGKDVVFVENLEFTVKESDIFYIVTIPGEKKATYFKLTALDSKGFTCENPAHDFPTKIVYRYDGKNVKATISGGEKSVDYDFSLIK